MAANKNLKIRCISPTGCTLTRTWDTQKPVYLKSGEDISVPLEIGTYLINLTNWKKTPRAKKKPKA